MTAIVDLDPATAETLHAALGPDSLGAAVARRPAPPPRRAARRGQRRRSAPRSTSSAALALAEPMRVTRPSLGVILVRRRVDTSVLTDALRAGVREVVEERDLAGLEHRRAPRQGARPQAARDRRRR